ncbi:MAG: N-6 DNA methylase [Chitinophagaceae bacterium]|nr:N-6 DNA methylase [Chitinophagaceae bacterium]
MNDELKYGLEQLEMIDAKGYSFGLVPVENSENLDTGKYSAEEIIAIENALHYGADYIYFRRFKNRPPVVQVYIYDYTTSPAKTNDALISLHQRLYSSGHVPMFFAFSNREVRIFNCYDRPAKGNNLIYKPLTTIKLAADVTKLFNEIEESEIAKLKAFSGRSFDNGSFWEDSSFSGEFQFANSAYEKLLTELKQSLKDIIDQKILPGSIARKIMVISILIKYLEERTDNHLNSVFPKAGETRVAVIDGRRQKIKFDKNFFDQFSRGATTFTDVLKKKGAGLKLLNYLATHFNGGIFELSQRERTTLAKMDLTRFALFLEGKLEGAQFVFWRLYSFNDLPVELISNIYEEFLEKKPGVVYTPPYLVNFLLDESMPLKNEETNFKVLDPACGSGVFLVGAFRRLIHRWRKVNNWKKPKLPVLKKLLIDNIFGSDKDVEAVNLTIFSLCLALCDELTPLEIWENLEFDDLTEKNIFSNDFFSLIQQEKFKKNTFDLVIGNPPFEAKLTTAGKQVEKKAIENRTISDKTEKGKNYKIKLPDNQISLLFLDQSIQLCKPGKLICLIQPSGPLLYNNTSYLFRKYLLEKFNVPQVIDFTHISRVLFGKNGDVATAAIFVKNEKANSKGLLHLTVRRTKPNKEKIYFELDTYDFHFVPMHIALNDPLIWKSNFLGGSRIHQFLSRLSHLRTLGQYVKEKKWISEEGYMIGGKKANKKAPHITGSMTLPAKAFTEIGIDDSMIEKVQEKLFYYLPNPAIFKAPHILIKEIISNDKIPVSLRFDDLTFQSRIVGIHGNQSDIKDLKFIEKEIANNKIYPFYIAATSGQYLVNKSSAILKQDIDNLPFPKNRDELKLDFNEQILLDDFWNYLLDFRRSGEKSFIALNDASKNDLALFGKIYCDVLNTVYSNLKCHTPFETDSYVCYPFYFKDKPAIEFDDKEKAEKQIAVLVKKVAGVSLRLTRIVRLYEGNVIYLIKPKKLRYWIGSVALTDADETFSDLRKQGF